MGADQSKKSNTVGTSTDKYLPSKIGGRKKPALTSTADVSIGRGVIIDRDNNPNNNNGACLAIPRVLY